MTFPVLTALVVVPLLGALITALVPSDRTAKLTAIAASLVTLALTVLAALQFELGGPL